jgi:isoleucyl-tRNA synthetase
MIVRYKILHKQRVEYIPGWDCHGLPIELKAVKESEWGIGPLVIRQKAREFAQQTMLSQMDEFKSWCVTGDWKNKYSTMGNNALSMSLT